MLYTCHSATTAHWYRGHAVAAGSCHQWSSLQWSPDAPCAVTAHLTHPCRAGPAWPGALTSRCCAGNAHGSSTALHQALGAVVAPALARPRQSGGSPHLVLRGRPLDAVVPFPGAGCSLCAAAAAAVHVGDSKQGCSGCVGSAWVCVEDIDAVRSVWSVCDDLQCSGQLQLIHLDAAGVMTDKLVLCGRACMART